MVNTYLIDVTFESFVPSVLNNNQDMLLKNHMAGQVIPNISLGNTQILILNKLELKYDSV